MNTLIPKVAAAIVSLGGAIAVLSETKNSDNLGDLLSENTSLTEKPKKRVPNKNDCNVYSVDYENEFQGSRYTRKVKKVEEQFWTKDEFLQEVKDRNLWNKEYLEEKVVSACSKEEKRAFVWWGVADSKKTNKTWVFDESINKENWLNKNISVPEYWPEELRAK